MKRALGLALMGFSLLTISIVLTLSKVAQNISETSGTWHSNILKYQPFLVWVFIIIAILISIRLMNEADV